MANTIRHKRGTTTPSAGSLVTGELAINTSTGAVFTKTDGGSVVNIAGSATASWGGISGTLSAQTDLQGELDLKANLAGATFTGQLTLAASTTAAASLNIPHGTAPSTLTNGDIWTTTTGLVARINNGTRTFAMRESGNFFSAGTRNTFSHGATTAGLNVGPVAGDPSALTNGDIWHNSTTNALNARVNGVTMPLNAVKAWVNFNGTGTVAIRASLNVSSITDNGVGDYTVNFTTALADTNYAVTHGNCNYATWVQMAPSSLANAVAPAIKTTTAVRLAIFGGAGAFFDSTDVSVAIVR